MTFDITEDLVGDLGVNSASLTTFANTDFLYDYAIGGLPFLTAISNETPFERAFAQVRRQQLDTAPVAGEQSLSNWWLRSQYTFTGGAGQELYEPAQDELVRTRFHNSQGVDPWTEGRLTLLPAAPSLHEIMNAVTDQPGCLIAGAQAGGVSYLIFSDGSNTYRWNEADYQTVTDLTAQPSWLWPMGDKVLSCFNGGIDIIDVATHDKLHTRTCTGTPKAWWVKRRIIAAVGNDLWEIADPFSGSAFDGGTPVATDPDPDWVWTSVVETPDSILACGYSGSKGAVYRIGVQQTDGTLLDLTAPSTVLEFPQGEVPTAMLAYLGSYVAIGTNKGVRIAQVGSQGQMQIGALTVESSLPVEHLTARDRFIFAGVTAGQPDGSSGAVRIDLSTPDNAGRYPYAWDIACGDNSTVTGLTQVGTSGRVVVASGAVYVASATELVESGWLDCSAIIFGTLEPKQFMHAEVKATYPGGSLDLSSVVDGNYELRLSYSSSNRDAVTALPSSPQTRMGLRLTLNRSSTDPTLGPVVTGWQVKALPAVSRQELIRVPLLCYDSEKDSAGNVRSSSAWARYTALANACREAATVTFQILNERELVNVVVEELNFTQTTPPQGFDGFGGVVYLTLRVV